MLLNLLDVLLVSGGSEDEGGEHNANGGGGRGLHHGDRLGTLKGASDSNLALNSEAKKPQKEGEGCLTHFWRVRATRPQCPASLVVATQAVCHSE